MYSSCYPIDLFDENFYIKISDKVNSILKNIPEIKHYEIFCNSSKDTKITYEKGEIKDATQKSGGGLGLRVIGEKGNEGITFTSDFSDQALELICFQSKKMMNASTSNPFFRDLAFPSRNYAQISGTFDPQIVDICPDDIDDVIKPLLELKSRRIKPRSLSGSFSGSFGTVFISNSNGIRQWEKYTTVGCNVECSLQQNGIPSSGFDWQTVCRLEDLNVQLIADNCYRMAQLGLKKKNVTSGKYPIILSPLAVASFIITPISQAINAERVQNQMSFLSEHIDQQIGNSLLNIKDDPHIPCKIGTERFDAEGVATTPLKIVDNGILKNFYHNSLTASKANTVSNGHASRGSYSNNIGIGNYNLIMQNGSKSYLDIIGEIKKGIYFEYSGDSPNYISGDFSGLIMTGYLIENGELGPALMETLININLKDVFNSISEISIERKWIDEIYAPYVKLDSATISGRNL